MQHEHLLQKRSSEDKIALQARFWQIRVSDRSCLIFSGGIWLRSAGIWMALSFLRLAGGKVGELSMVFFLDLFETKFRRCSIILNLVNPVYFLSFPISAQMISSSSLRLQDWRISGASLDHWAISWTSSLLSLKLSPLHFSGLSTKPENGPRKICIFHYILFDSLALDSNRGRR